MLHRPPITAHDDSGKRMEGIPTKFLLRWSGPHPLLHNSFRNVYTVGLEGNDKDGWSKTTTVNVARSLRYIPFKHSSAPSIWRASVEARKKWLLQQLCLAGNLLLCFCGAGACFSFIYRMGISCKTYSSPSSAGFVNWAKEIRTERSVWDSLISILEYYGSALVLIAQTTLLVSGT
jgi:hypothetical protein